MKTIRLAAALALSVGAAAPLYAGFTEQLAANFALEFAVLGQCSANQVNYNNGNIVGDIGLCAPRSFTISNANLTGNIRFSGASNTSGLSPDVDPGSSCGPFTVSGGGFVTGCVVANDAKVAQAMNFVNVLSATLGVEAGTPLSITSGGSVNASAGTFDGANRVFTVGAVNFPNGAFTINGSASDYVVLNLTAGGNVHGQILLAGGITADHVLINVFGAGQTLDVNTNGLATFGIFVDPNGTMSAVNTDIRGRFFGGDAQNMQIVSGLNITAPPVTSTPEPTSLALLATGLIGFAGARFRRRRESAEA